MKHFQPATVGRSRWLSPDFCLSLPCSHLCMHIPLLCSLLTGRSFDSHRCHSHPELVSMEAAEDFASRAARQPKEAALQMHAPGFATKAGWQSQDLNAHGVVGAAASLSCAHKGEVLADECVDGLVRLLTEVGVNPSRIPAAAPEVALAMPLKQLCCCCPCCFSPLLNPYTSVRCTQPTWRSSSGLYPCTHRRVRLGRGRRGR